ncbi:MAG: phosphoribosylaminoimidazolesuccinocarboxamide synthase [Candidatus ainarchaeum sp.]|nr:phosphoribosylaminoimidazolesuccinocarboxamide synthase [Candidatus ainarchaeum sp.]
MVNPILKTNLNYPLLHRGKVRDVYDLEENLLLVSSDRLSAFDVVFNEGIPRKGEVLTQLSLFWFEKTKHIIKNHLVNNFPKDFPEEMKKRSVIGVKTKPVKLECIVRGYLTGSGWKSYQKDGTICGIKLPLNLKNGSKLPEPIFTPTTKAEQGHDQDVTEDKAIEIVGQKTFDFVKRKSIELYSFAEEYARSKGLILADTKFEFGEYNGEIILIDEALTPDSSRYWLKSDYDKGKLLSLDKQFARDYLETLNWDKKPPAPPLPEEIIEKTSKRYLQAYNFLTGKNL